MRDEKLREHLGLTEIDGVMKERFQGFFYTTRSELEAINRALDLRYVFRDGHMRGIPVTRLIETSRAERKLDKLLEYLGLEFQENCTEKLPQIVKKRKKTNRALD